MTNVGNLFTLFSWKKFNLDIGNNYLSTVVIV